MDALRLRGPPFVRFNGGANQPGHPHPHPQPYPHAPTHPHPQQGPHVMGPHGLQQEPLIVVEESNLPEELEPESSDTFSNRASLDIDSPVNPYLLSPWRDPREARKHSLPSQQVTDGITASQVRRLSERGGEGSGPSPKEAAFLATLSQAPAPSGRRHSVVTISKVPTTFFGRSRRESVAAAYPSNNGSSRVLNSRRESNTGPPSTDPIGSIHNLQLDIMDDIYLQSRKARLKLWTSSNEKVCEVQTVDEAGIGAPGRRYTNRRYSECPPAGGAGGAAGAGGGSGVFRRASEYPQPPSVSPQPPSSARASTRRKKSGSGLGLLGSRTDLAGIFSSLTGSSSSCVDPGHRPDPDGGSSSSHSSAATGNSATSPFLSQTFQQAARGRTTSATPTPSGGQVGSSMLLDPNAGRSTRSNSFDVSILNNAKQLVTEAQDNSSAAISGWFGVKKSAPVTPRKKSVRSKSSAMALSKDVLERLQTKDPLCGDSGKPKLKPRSKKKSWADATKANIVDATILGTAIEGFLRKSSNASMGGGSTGNPTGASTSTGIRSGATRDGSKGAVPKESGAGSASGSAGRRPRQSAVSSAASSAQSQAGRAMRSTLNWFGKGDEDDSKDTCDASLCATLKDLFVK